MIDFFNKPVFVWFGIFSAVSLFVTLFLGFNIKKFGFKKHRFFAVFTLVLVLLHFFFGANAYFF